MTHRQHAGALKLWGNFAPGFNGWGILRNGDIKNMSYMIQPSVKNVNISTATGLNPVQGDMYLVGTTRTGFPSGTPAHALVVYDGGGWQFLPATIGAQVYNETTESFYVFRGTWEPVIPPLIGIRRDLAANQGINSANADSFINFQPTGQSFVSGTGLQYSTATHILSVRDAGYYDIKAQIGTTGSGQVRIYKGTSGIALADILGYSAVGSSGGLASCVAYLQANSSVRIRFRTDVALLVLPTPRTYFTCHKIG